MYKQSDPICLFWAKKARHVAHSMRFPVPAPCPLQCFTHRFRGSSPFPRTPSSGSLTGIFKGYLMRYVIFFNLSSKQLINKIQKHTSYLIIYVSKGFEILKLLYHQYCNLTLKSLFIINITKQTCMFLLINNKNLGKPKS